jgi:hypothetical protein
MGHGVGSLIFPTRDGVRVVGMSAARLPTMPAPVTWAHSAACAWAAAWLTARDRHMVGTRELLFDDFWRGDLEWLERSGLRRRGHRPDLLAGLALGEPLLPIEVELASKSTPRLRSILALYATWIAAGKTSAVIYLCGTEKLAERVRAEGSQFGLTVEQKTLRVELLETIRHAALAARAHTHRSAREVVTAENEVTG